MSGSTASLLALATVTVACLVNEMSWLSVLVWPQQYAELRSRFDVMTLTGAPGR
jgi:hypothetical protein